LSVITLKSRANSARFRTETINNPSKLQERKSRILSIIIACLVVLLIATILALFALPMMIQETPTIVTYSAELKEEPELQEKKVVQQTLRKPAAPAQNIAKVIASNTSAPTAIPVPDVMVTEPSANFGDDLDFGQGWGDDGFEGGGATFFGQQAKGNRIAYVIDFSLSMREAGGHRERLMRQEMAQSVAALPPGMQFQMIFFSGPSWVAGDNVVRQGHRATVTSGNDKFEWRSPGGAHAEFKWDVVDPKKVQTPIWYPTTQTVIQNSLKLIEETRLIGGTVWMPPMQMAMRMDPPPQVIFFMTDGIVEGRDTVQLAEDIAAMCRAKGTVVNTVALMEPKARKAMVTLAHQTGGTAMLVNSKGERLVLKD